MPAFFGRRDGDRVVILGSDAEHLARPLRARPGEEIEVIDPEGFLLTVKLDTVSPTFVEGTVVAERAHQPEPRSRITVAIANLPAPALELVLSRCTEAGAHAFVVFHADRGVGRGEKLERWSTISREAAMLAGRLRVPEVAVASSLEAALGAAENPILLAREAPRRLADIADLTHVTLFVGPEGGWSERELDLAEVTATLGPRNLRADTAALVAVAMAVSVRGG
ncbi:MAG TPA: RsmE family RNA methyltransferase [Candidatus Limnocylindrales bacterium]|nr:RsmE family RNA methyltransferase [Candidatus Limnocylindrales bacterium]